MNKLFFGKKQIKRWISVVLILSIIATSLGLENFIVKAQAATTYTTIYLKDDTAKHWIGNDNAVIELVDNTYGHDHYIMTKEDSNTWSVSVPSTTYNVTFNRLSPNKDTQWNSWSAGGRGNNRNDKNTWHSTYHATVPEHGYWDGMPQYTEGFHEGDVIYLDYYEFQNWELANAQFYVNFTNASKSDNNGADISLSNADKSKFSPILLSNEIEEQVYTYTVTAKDEGATELRFFRGNNNTLWNESVILSYADYKEGNNCVKVQGWDDTGYVCPYVPRRHVPIINSKKLEITGNKKVNRKITINLAILGETEYLDLQGTKIAIEKLDSNGEVINKELGENDLLYDLDANKWNHRELIFKQSGSYRVSTITYSNDRLDSYQTEEIINVADDNAPIADLRLLNIDNENSSNNKFVRNTEGILNLKIEDQSISEFNDEIISRQYKIYYDENQDGIYKEDELIDTISGNDINFNIQLNKVGKYQIVENIKESFQDTIKSLLTEDDFLTGEVINEFEIVNQSPISTMSVGKSKIADIIFTVGNADGELLNQYAAITGNIKSRFEEHGIEANISTVSTSALTATDTFAWKEYDHYNYRDYYLPTLDKHIIYDGKDIKMLGYSEEPLKDFLYVEDNSSSKKIFEFDLQRDKTDWHSMEGGGFLFNTVVSDNENYIQGYCILVTQKGLNLVQINKTNLSNFRNGYYRYVQSAGKLLKSVNIGNLYENHHFKIVIKGNVVTVYDGDKIAIDEFVLPDDGVDAYGYGPIISHDYHCCGQQSYFTFKNIIMQTVTGESLSDVVNNHEWTPGENHYVVNLSETSVPELSDNNRMSDVSAALISNSAHFYGIGNDNTINQYNALLNSIDGMGENIKLVKKSEDSDEVENQLEVTVDTAVNQIVSQIIADINSKDYEIKDVISSDEKVEYFGTYFDLDGDEKGEEIWNYEYNPSVFGEINEEIQHISLSEPITMFTNTGAYTITHKVRDKLGNEDDNQNMYALWSNEDDYKKLIVSQHRPVAEIDVNMSQAKSDKNICMVNVQYNAFDEDHPSDTTKGIRKEEFYYKEINDTNWTEGRFPTSVKMGTTYLIKYVVTDIEGTKSQKRVVSVKTNEAREYVEPVDNNPPTVFLTVSDEMIEVGNKFYVEASAEDDYGVVDFEIKHDEEIIGTKYGRFECVVNDPGEYVITVTATDIGGNQVTESKTVTIIDNTDITAPTIEITSPVNGSIAGDTDIVGTIKDDKKLKNYVVTRTTVATADDGTVVNKDSVEITSGTEEIIDGIIATVETDSLVDGMYRYEIVAQDMAGNISSAACIVTVRIEMSDQIPPQAAITDIILDNETKKITVYGNVLDETEISSYELYLKKNESSAEEKLIASGNSQVTEGILGIISTESLESGEYSLRLFAVDANENTCENVAGFTFRKGTSGNEDIDVDEDLTAPVIMTEMKAEIKDGKLVFHVDGTIDDENLSSYDVVTGKLNEDGEIINGRIIASGDKPVINDVIADYSFDGYEIGNYGVTISALDKAGNLRTVQYVITINSKGVIENGYSGEDDDEEEVKEKLLNLTLAKSIADVGEEINAYITYPKNATNVRLTANGKEVGISGRTAVITSDKGCELEVVLHAIIEGEDKTVTKTVRFFDRRDQTHPIVEFVSPKADSELKTKTDIIANIYDETSLAYYVLEYKMAGTESNYIELARGTNNIYNEKVGALDTTKLMNGSYLIRITAVDNGGNRIWVERTVNVSGNLKVGNMALGFTDIHSNVAGLPLTVNRNYDSRNKSCGDFGYGWTMGIQSAKITESNPITSGYNLVQRGNRLSTSYYMEQTLCHDITVVYGDGTSDKFELKVTPERSALIPIYEVMVNFICVTDKNVKLELAGNNCALVYGSELIFEDPDMFEKHDFILTRADGTKLYLNTEYGLTKMEDANGNTVTITKSGYKHSSGNSVLFTRDEKGRVIKAEEMNGNGEVITEITYDYDNKGNLIAVTDNAARTVAFTYDDEHNLVDIIDPSGVAVARNIYDEDGRLVATIDADGNRTEYEHDLDAKMEVVRDKMGNATVYYYDENGNVLKTVDALGNVTENTYNADNKVATKKDANGNITRFEYDENKNLSTLTTAEGVVENIAYNQLNLVSGITFDGQNLANFDYDDSGNLTQMEDAVGNTTDLSYDNSGKLLGITDAIGTIHRLTYDSEGNLVSMTDGNGNITKYNYDSNGQCTGVTVKRTDTDGIEREYTSIYTYDHAGNVQTVTSPSGKVVSYEYDFRNNKTAQIDSEGKRIQYSYDNQDKLTLVAYPDGTTERFTYDANGNVITATNRMGITITNMYDKLDRLVKKMYADGAEESYTYDANGNVLTHTLLSGGVISYTYDCMNRNTSITDGYGNVTTFEYNKRSLVTKQTDALGNSFEYQYDDNGNQIKIIYPDGAIEETEYDARNRVISKTDRNGNVTEYTYDDADNLIAVIDSYGNAYKYTYDETYELTKVTDTNGNETSYEYDADGRLVKIVNALGYSYNYSYDNNGYQTGYRDFSGKNTSYVYDENRRITAINNDDGTTKFAYDEFGRITTVTDANGSITYTYDEYSRICSKSTYDYGTITYTYNASDEISSITTSVNNETTGTTSYEYDLMDRIVRVVGHDGSATLYEYDAIGNRTKVRHEGGLVVEYQYDLCKRLINETVTDTDGSILMYYGYTYGNAGEKTTATEVVRETTDDTDARVIYTEYKYDNLLRLTSEAIHVKDEITFDDLNFNEISRISWSGNLTNQYNYDKVSNRISKSVEITGNLCGLEEDVHKGTTEYTYNALNQLTEALYTDEADKQLVTTYRYDMNGNLVSEHGGSSDKNYTYNANNQLITATVSSGNAVTIESYSYDYEGNRVTKQINEDEKVYYLNDTYGELTQVAMELRKNSDNTYEVKKYYTRGTELISVDLTDELSTAKKLFVQDGHGSVTALVETQAGVHNDKTTINVITDTYVYDAYGNLLKKTGNTDNDYLYTGEQYNELTKLYYLRARYMSPKTGTFTSVDSYAGSLDNPVSLHKYLYANANPVMYTDPTGNFSLMETSVAQGIQATINDVIVPYFNIKKIMSWANLAVTAYDVAGQVRLILAGEANIIGLATAIAKGMITQTLINCTAKIVLGEAAATVLKIVGIAQDTKSFIEAVKSGDPEKIVVESVRLAVSLFTLKCQCFTGDTLVSTEDGYCRIDEIEVGDKVWAYNTETDENELREVLATPITKTDILVHVTLSDGEEIETTMFHPFYVQDEESAEAGRWTAASNLVSGDKLLMEDGQEVYVEKVRIEKLAKSIKVYNLEVDELHTYYVGDGVLVHNKYGEASETSDGKSSENNLDKILDIMKKGKKTPDGKNIIYQLDDITKVIFRMDIGEDAHEIISKGYLEPVNHINIEIQKCGLNGKYKSKWDYHIVLDELGNTIDQFALGVWTK